MDRLQRKLQLHICGLEGAREKRHRSPASVFLSSSRRGLLPWRVYCKAGDPGRANWAPASAGATNWGN